MYRMMNKLFLPIVLFLILQVGYSQDKQKDFSDAFNLIEVWLEAQRDFEKLPGITAIIVKDQQVLWKGGYGMANIEEQIPADPSTLFSICSISKLFTAIAIMKLYEEGKLRLDDRVDDILPSYNLSQIYPESGPVTVRTLLTHSSGLPREAAFPYWTGPDFPFPTRDKILEKLDEQETLYPASTYFQYSNLGLTLLGEIIEKISNQPYGEYITRNILEPLDLKNTRTELPESLYGQQMSIGYSAIDRTGERQKVNFFQASGIKAAAGFSSNVEDLGKFASWQFRLSDTTKAEILRPSTLKYMYNVHWIDPDWETTWGLGFKVRKTNNNQTEVSHVGNCPGYRSSFNLYPKNKLAYVVMINASGATPQKYVDGMIGIMDKIKETEENGTSKEGGEHADLEEYTGYFSQQPWWSEAYIGEWQGKLVMLSLPANSPGESMTLFKPVLKDTFRRIREDEELGETLVFQRDESGKVHSFRIHENYSYRINR
jgi:CubicO group peptidase (beta-lactamase class C family)